MNIKALEAQPNASAVLDALTPRRAVVGISGDGAATKAAPVTGSGAGNAGVITSNDFLTLLVSELKNQDPTAQTDPNAYINQLVQVNSLQQLISINQDLSQAPAPNAANAHPVFAAEAR